MNILMVGNRFPPETLGGAERVAAGLAGALARRGHTVRVLAATPARSGAGNTTAHGAAVRRFYPGSVLFPDAAAPLPRRLAVLACAHGLDVYNPLARRALARTVRDARPDVLHTHALYGLSAGLWAAAAAARLPVVHTAHDAWLLSPRHNLRGATAPRGPLALLYRTLYRRRLGCVDLFCSPSQALLELHHAHGFRPRAARVIPHGVERPRPLRRTAAADAPALRVLFLGRLDRHKGVPVLLDAARLLKDDARIAFTLAGSGPLEPGVRAAADALPRLRYFGSTDDAGREQLFRECTVIVLPSLCPEGFGLVVAEGAVRGLPAVVTALGGQAEQVRRSGAGLTVPPGDAAALAETFRALAADPAWRAALAEGARAAAPLYSLDGMAAAYESAYRAVIAARPPCTRKPPP
jgi:glycosyltransferase involved in cell wall biosynthesis